MRSLTERPSASEISVTLSRFGRKRRLVLMFEWLTLWPTWGPLPVKSQRRDMVEILETSAGTPGAPISAQSGTRTYKGRAAGRQAAQPWGSRNHRFDAFGREEARGSAPAEGLRVLRHRSLSILLGASVALAAFIVPADAQSKLEARYTASLSGIPLGTGSWVID